MLALMLVLQAAAPVSVQRSGSFANRRVTESSGVVVSRAHPGVLWTANDSGDGPYLYATTVSGADGGAVRVAGAAAVDWEDLALGPCPTVPGDCVYIADTGDNLEVRSDVAVYAVPEPPPPAGAADTASVSGEAAVLRLRYPDGPHDVEALFVTGAGVVYLVTKGRRGIWGVYRVPRTAWGSTGVTTAIPVQPLPLAAGARAHGWVTGADFHATGARVVIRTYGDIRFFALSDDGLLAAAGPACDIRGLEPQGEAVAFLDDHRVVLTSEAGRGVPGSLHVVSCPEGDS